MSEQRPETATSEEMRQLRCERCGRAYARPRTFFRHRPCPHQVAGELGHADHPIHVCDLLYRRDGKNHSLRQDVLRTLAPQSYWARLPE
jgi:hypothetical protein